MPDPNARAVELVTDAVDSLQTSLALVEANPDSDDDGGIPAFEAVLAGIGAYLQAPDAVHSALQKMDGPRAAGARVLLEAIDRVQTAAVQRLAQEATTREGRSTLHGIASMLSGALGEFTGNHEE